MDLVVFAFNRPDKLKVVLSALSKQTLRPDRVIAFLDGPRHTADEPLVAACKAQLAGHGGILVERQKNLGCAASIMYGLATAIGEFQSESFAVIEDDVVPSSRWFEAMSIMLKRYEFDEQVGAVGSFPSICLDDQAKFIDQDVLFSPRFSCWGWGSWKAKWSQAHAEWLAYSAGQLAWDPHSLPTHAGHDLPGMISNLPPGFLWDGLIAGVFLRRQWLHAVTKWTMIKNIGADKHAPPDKLAFMAEHCPVFDRIPTTMPDAAFSDAMNQAVCRYVRVMG